MSETTDGEPTEADPQPPDRMVGRAVLGRYRIVARLAAGGMGVVYLARAEGAAGFAKPMVVKRILPEHHANANIARLFVREAKILANLQHPNIVGVTDFGEEDGAYIMVLDYVRAYHLGLWLAYRREQGWKLPAFGAIYIMCKVLDALEYAHTLALPDGTSLDIIHADISPSNILIDTDGHVKLLDFGIARMRGETTKSTERATIRGKLAYLPLEALDGSAPGVRTDVYGAAITLYELLAGTHPFSVEDDTVTIARVISHTPPPISTVRPDVPPELDAILARGMSKLRDDRYASAKEFARELRRVLPVSEDEVAASVAQLVKQDFANMPNMPDLGALSLADLEEAWRNPPAASVAIATGRHRAIEFAPTQPPDPELPTLRSPVVDSPAPPPKKSAALPIAISIGVAVAIGLVTTIAILVLKREPEEPNVIVVERNGQGGTGMTTASSGAVPVTTLAPMPSAAAGAVATAPDAGTKAPAGRQPDPLTAAFAKNLPAVEACVNEQAAGVDGAPEITIRFQLDPAGVVQKVDLSPPAVASTPLGQCISGVAMRTKFPPQPQATKFSIPVSLKTRRAP